LLILSTDGLFRVYSQDYVANRVLALRDAGYNLAQISEKIIEECLEPEKGKRAANDNITLIIVDLAAYYNDRAKP
jgi:serine/threonine protein phosphatase PrpC